MKNYRASVASRLLVVFHLATFLLASAALPFLATACSPGIIDLDDGSLSSRLLPQVSSDLSHLLGLVDGKLTLVAFPTGEVMRTFRTERKHKVAGFAWSPGGDVFAYHTEHSEPEGKGGIYLAHLNGSTEKIADLEAPELGPREILWSPCGRYLFWEKPFTVYDRETGRLLVRADIDTRGSSIRFPLFSRDGSKLAYTLFEDTGPENLWVMDTSSGDTRKVTDEGKGDYPFHWVNDTRLLVRTGAVSTGGGHISGMASIDLQSGDRTPVDVGSLVDLGLDVGPLRRFHVVIGVSPDGHYVIGESSSPSFYESWIYRLDLASGQREVIMGGESPTEHYLLLQVLWTGPDEMILSVRRTVHDGAGNRSSDRYQIHEYIMGSGTRLLVESEAEMHPLGIVEDRLYYLESIDFRSCSLRNIPAA